MEEGGVSRLNEWVILPRKGCQHEKDFRVRSAALRMSQGEKRFQKRKGGESESCRGEK